MELKANNKVEGYPSSLYLIEDIFFQRDPGVLDDPNFSEDLDKSIRERGMEYPIIITTQEAFKDWMSLNKFKSLFPKPLDVPHKYRCSIGNNRMHWAVENGYTEIECIFTKNWRDSADITPLTQVTFRRN